MSENSKEASWPGLWRTAGWSAAGLLLLLPWLAMQFTGQVAWNTADFLLFAALLLGAGGAFELAVRMSGNTAYRLAAAVALMAAFLLMWISLGVGIIGKDGDPANQMYLGVLAVGVAGAIAARFKPRGMACTLYSMAFAQALVTLIALVARLGLPWDGPLEILALNGFFIVIFLGSGWLFGKSGGGRSEGRAG